MNNSQPESIFNRLLYYSVKFKEQGIISREAEMFSEFNIYELNNMYDELINKICKFSKKIPINVEYYLELLNVEYAELKEKFIFKNDPFWPLYKHLEALLNDLKHMDNLLPDKISYIETDVLIKSILSARKIFLHDLSSSIRKKYTFLKRNIGQRLEVKRRIKFKLDSVLFKQTRIHQKNLPRFLNKNQRRFKEYKKVSKSFMNLKNYYFNLYPFRKMKRNKSRRSIIYENKKDNDLGINFSLKSIKFNVLEKRRPLFLNNDNTTSLLSPHLVNDNSIQQSPLLLKKIPSCGNFIFLCMPLLFILFFAILMRKL
ncbi:hypothetical protein NBO_25g0008 [Nosema bombycis CQ1]|uniref:Uncharacterized protein n=1 Tax=Nosema bombycis (strain CQ1 / CVCC 102059) TaxID=578461 RepID=R0KWF3_NOSB1|nr:hypothetical protein NBO_25g0008 [Nosema bombycis CQ1]|eukprot:EOB14547.1 hypothetical protein NBO_25g0008 [Nosema bombycis CQ1]